MEKYSRFSIALFFTFFTLFLIGQADAQSPDGYWKFTELQIRGQESDTREELRRSYISGGPGYATFNTETDWGDITLVFRANGRYTEPPQVLIPGEIIELPYSISKTQFRRPDWHWNPGAHISIRDTRLHSDPNRGSRSKNYGAFVISGMGDTDSESDVAVIVPPDYHADGVGNYVLTFFIGSSRAHRYFDYNYEWIPGEPSVEELGEAMISDPIPHSADQDDHIDTEADGFMSVMTYKRGDVQVRTNGHWRDAVAGEQIPHGSQIRTGPDAIAEIILVDGTFVRMRPGTTLDIPLLRDDSEKIGLKMFLGNIWLRFRSGNTFNAETSSAIAGIRGTELGIEVNESGRETFICYSGEIEVIPIDDSGNPEASRAIILGRGEKVVLNPTGDWTVKIRIGEIEQSVGAIFGSSDFTTHNIMPQERDGRLFVDRESGDWRLQIYEQNRGARHGLLFFEDSVIRDVAGYRLTSPFGVLLYHGSYNENKNSGWLIIDETVPPEVTAEKPLTGEDLGYSIVVPEGQLNEVHIMRNGEPAWSFTRFMVLPEYEMDDQTGNGIPNLLIRYARGRSFRGFIFLELGAAGVIELWGLEEHASVAYDIEDEIMRRREQGESLEEPPRISRQIWVEGTPEPVQDGPHRNEHITLAADSFNRGEPIDIQWQNLPGNQRDWITVVPAEASERTWGNAWWYTEGNSSGIRAVNFDEPGEYEIRVYFDWPDGSYEIQSRLIFHVR